MSLNKTLLKKNELKKIFRDKRRKILHKTAFYWVIKMLIYGSNFDGWFLQLKMIGFRRPNVFYLYVCIKFSRIIISVVRYTWCPPGFVPSSSLLLHPLYYYTLPYYRDMKVTCSSTTCQVLLMKWSTASFAKTTIIVHSFLL